MSWLYSQALVEESSEGISLDGEPCALWNGKHTRLPSWCSDKTMARCQLSQSGMTFKPLTDDHGEAVLMSCLEASPVRTSPVLEKAKASRETDHPCGNTWRESLEKFDLDTHSWKTHQCLWDEDLQPSSVTLPKWGMMRSGVLWERTTSPLPTSGTESGSWPTPTCQEVEHPDAELTDTGRRLSKDGKSSHSLNLADSVKKWPTPRAREWKDTGDLEKLAKLIDDGHEETLARSVAKNEVAMWPTPQASDNRDRGCMDDDHVKRRVEIGKQIGLSTRVKEKRQPGSLNPTWVEWLMGWPIGWTSMEPITELDWRDWDTDPADELPPENWSTPVSRDSGGSTITPNFPKGFNQNLVNDVILTKRENTGPIPRVATGIKHRVGRLKAIGNGQVPQVAAMAWQILTENKKTKIK